MVNIVKHIKENNIPFNTMANSIFNELEKNIITATALKNTADKSVSGARVREFMASEDYTGVQKPNVIYNAKATAKHYGDIGLDFSAANLEEIESKIAIGAEFLADNYSDAHRDDVEGTPFELAYIIGEIVTNHGGKMSREEFENVTGFDAWKTMEQIRKNKPVQYAGGELVSGTGNNNHITGRDMVMIKKPQPEYLEGMLDPDTLAEFNEKNGTHLSTTEYSRIIGLENAQINAPPKTVGTFAKDGRFATYSVEDLKNAFIVEKLYALGQNK